MLDAMSAIGLPFPPPLVAPLRQRARAATATELVAIPWLQVLDAEQRRQVVAQLKVADAEEIGSAHV